MRTDVISGAAVIALGAAALIASAGFPPAGAVAEDPALLPRTVAVGLVATGLGMVAAGIGGRRAAAPFRVAHVPESLQQPSAAPQPARRLTLIAFVLLVAYAGAAFGVGYLTATVAFLVAFPLLLGWGTDRRRLALLAVFAVALAATLYGGFFVLLEVPTPRTPLP